MTDVVVEEAVLCPMLKVEALLSRIKNLVGIDFGSTYQDTMSITPNVNSLPKCLIRGRTSSPIDVVPPYDKTGGALNVDTGTANLEETVVFKSNARCCRRCRPNSYSVVATPEIIPIKHDSTNCYITVSDV